MNSNHNATDPREALPSAADRQPDADSGAPLAGPVRVSSQSLFSGAHEVEIEHHGAVYRLRQTSLGKLILTK
ncbi:MAG: hemin uptake protein HemP [Pseudomonadota bacterium]